MSKKIKFIKTIKNYPDTFEIVPANKILPDWYKSMTSYDGQEKYEFRDGIKPSTIKKCIPVLDAISSGYLIRLQSDLKIHFNEDSYEYFPAPRSLPVIDFHPVFQAKLYPADLSGYEALPKILNSIGIKTPKGYSCMFVPPMHRDNVIQILPGIVDTDSYNAPVSFPFLISKEKFSGVIPAGTPIVQIIPFKRDPWELEFSEDLELKNKTDNKLFATFYNGYRNLFWSRKSFK